MINTTQVIEDNSIEDDDSLCIASKCWKRVMDAATKAGYREGIQDGADSVLQEGFELGFKDGFETAFMLGRYKSLVTAVSPTLKHPADINAVFDKTRRGACWICSMDSLNKIENIPFSEILNKQRTHSTEVTERLHRYVEPFLQKSSNLVNLTLN